MTEVNIERLSVGDLDLYPYYYEEKISSKGLHRIIVKIKFPNESSEELMKIKDLVKSKSYFPVYRHGISEEVHEMKFKIAFFSKHENEIKYEFVFITKRYDGNEDMLKPISIPLGNIQSVVANQTELLNELINLLLDKKVLNENEISVIRKKAIEHVWDRIGDFFEVDDIDNIKQRPKLSTPMQT